MKKIKKKADRMDLLRAYVYFDGNNKIHAEIKLHPQASRMNSDMPPEVRNAMHSIFNKACVELGGAIVKTTWQDAIDESVKKNA